MLCPSAAAKVHGVSWPYHPDLLARPVPRYTSYPTAVEFSDAVGEDALIEGLAPLSGDVSLYVHIPYCERICWYCGCNTGAAGRTQRLESYLEALDTEIGLVAALLPADARVTRIAFGGGSPNAIQPVAFVRLLDRLTTAFGAHAPQLSVELDPRGLTAEWARTLGASGVTHASLGVQTFDPAVQAAIGRVQPAQHIVDAVARLRDAGVPSLNFDLMYGLPQQDLAVLEATLDATLALMPERIALFGYAHVPDRIPRQRQIDATGLADAATRFAMAAYGYERLTAAGYAPVGFDHFALPGDGLARAAHMGTLRRNFQGFTDDAAEALIGLGASAITCLPDRIVQNEKNAGRYRMRLSQARLPAASGVLRSASDREQALIIEDILCGRAADLGGVGGGAAWRRVLAPFLERGLAALDGDLLCSEPAGRPYWRSIAACFDAYRSGANRLSSSAI